MVNFKQLYLSAYNELGGPSATKIIGLWVLFPTLPNLHHFKIEVRSNGCFIETCPGNLPIRRLTEWFGESPNCITKCVLISEYFGDLKPLLAIYRVFLAMRLSDHRFGLLLLLWSSYVSRKVFLIFLLSINFPKSILQPNDNIIHIETLKISNSPSSKDQELQGKDFFNFARSKAQSSRFSSRILRLSNQNSSSRFISKKTIYRRISQV